MKNILLAVICVACVAHAKTVYVSPSGSDTDSGSWWRPFATLERAQQEADGDPLLVLIKSGIYHLSKPIELTRSNVTYRAHSGQPIFTGGQRIREWQVRPDGVWETHLNAVESQQWNFAQLWVNGTRRFRPRLPKTGYFHAIDNVDKTAHSIAGFSTTNTLSTQWSNLFDMEVHTLHVWSASRYRIGAIESLGHTNVVRLTQPHNNAAYWADFKNRRFWIENIKEAFTEAGTWYLERKTGTLLYRPLPGETPRNSIVEVPRLAQLLIVKANHVTLEGLIFQQSNWVLPITGNFCPQAEMNIPVAVEIVQSQQITFDRCVFRQLGGYALGFGPGAHSNTVSSCVMTDLGAGGVKIGPPYIGYVNAQTAANPTGSEVSQEFQKNTSAITIRDSVIQGGGRIHPAAHGIWVGLSSYNTIVNNEISDLFYTSVSLGWVWGYQEPSKAHHNEVAFNHMHHIGQGVLSDMGGVYTLGISPGTRVHDNHIHDVQAYDYGGWGLYTDEGSTGIHMFNNLVYRVKTGGFHQHYGKTNLIENNIFAFSKLQQLQRTRNENHISFTFRKNIVYWDNDSPLFGSNWQGAKRGLTNNVPTEHFLLDHNLYWHTSGKQDLFPGKKTLAQWQRETGQDEGSCVADPRFTNPTAGDFSFQSPSPAQAIGFTPFDVITTTGPRNRDRLPIRRIPAVPVMHEVIR